jgi:phosphoribosylformylglycinamidine cyclo-ligase
MEKELSYKSSGVNIEAGYQAVQKITKKVKSTFNSQVLDNFGSFGALFAPDLSEYKEPVFVSGTDGVGTKVLLSVEANSHQTIGIDLVAMCVNDVICLGAKPLFFLDYIGIHELDPEKVSLIIDGIVEGCKRAKCALIGGETAEMRDVYKKGDYDLAGFVVGIVDKEKIITGQKIQENDLILRLPSSGLHSNGYTLARKVLDRLQGEAHEALLTEALIPTTIYVQKILNLCSNYDIHGIANITGGGLSENIERVLPNNFDAVVDIKSWDKLPIFEAISKVGNVSNVEMYRTFNMGVGMVVIANKEESDIIIEKDPTISVIGKITKGTKKVILEGINESI